MALKKQEKSFSKTYQRYVNHVTQITWLEFKKLYVKEFEGFIQVCPVKHLRKREKKESAGRFD